MNIFNEIAAYVRPHTDDIALALVATLLVIFGDTINDLARHVVRKQPVWARVLVFIALCTFGYGALSVWLTPVLEQYLRTLSAGAFLATVAGAFVLVGVLAERYHSR
ncbi:DUF3392 domain-containing protein [Thalassolituus marinus]|uniref:DUF3392 domain-containing protein n=1 Tax=Thalassolituus marinus TaxID=671053 RepID=A0ABS7ZK75_9GAMM|nr:DUF3392 domain-containing protein [Thalassolituus marinus]MCA6062107.1 DUF3392 domain-containing protein [Thalassolituus marinus]